MTELTKWFSNLSVREPALWLAIGSGFAILLFFLILGRRQRRAAAIVAAGNELASTADQWLPPPKRPDERRRSTRRSGVPTPVQVCDPKKPKRVVDGYVLDRSSGGLRLALAKPFPAGAALQIRPANAPPENPWIVIIVRSCREIGDYFEVGGQFQEELPWHLLLMFG
jgi:hypothetical protein